MGEMMQSWMAFEPELKKNWKEGLNSLANIGKSKEQGNSKNQADQAKAPGFSLPTDETRKNYANCYWYMMDGATLCLSKSLHCRRCQVYVFAHTYDQTRCTRSHRQQH